MNQFFIFDAKAQIIRAIDMDSAYINGCFIPTSKFLIQNENLYDFQDKYPRNPNVYDSVNIPNHNTQILCFIYMLLNV